MIINLSRQGLIYIPSLYILHAVLGINGLAWAQPVADVLSLILVVFLYRVSIHRLMKNDKQNDEKECLTEVKQPGHSVLNESMERAYDNI